MPTDEIVRPRVPLKDCLDCFSSPEEIHDFYSSALKTRTTATKTAGLTSFPDYLVLHMRKFVMVEGWVPKKLDVYIDVPDTIDISDMRSRGLQPGEELLPEGDVIGRIVKVYSPMEKVIGGKQTRLIDFVLEDVRQIHCTLWDEHVDQLIPYYNSTVVDPVILIIQLCRAKFMDNGEVRICSSFDATQLFFIHTSKEFFNFKNIFRGDYTPLRCIESVSRLAVGFPIYGVDSTNVFITSIEDIYKKKEDGVVSDDYGSRGLDAMHKEMEKDKIVDLGDNDGASSSEQANVPLKRCLIDEFDRVGGTSKKAKEIVVKLEKM